MPIELDNTSINIINGADTFQLEVIKSKGSYTEKAADSSVYSCGKGQSGQLGHGNTSPKYIPTLIQYFIDNSITISHIYPGEQHTIFLATNGYIYSCGWNADGQLGHGNTSAKNTPTLIQYFVDESITISKISAGSDHTIFLNTNGYVYSCGRGGTGGSSSTKILPTLIETYIDYNGNNINYTNITISEIHAGKMHTIFLATDNKLYSSGYGVSGQLGHGNISAKYTPTLIQYFVNESITISKISAGVDSTIFLDTNGYVYSCGNGDYGKLGHGNTSAKNTPTLIQYFVDESITISKISAGYYHSIFLATNGNVYSCGFGYYGQLGHDNTSDNYTPTPTLIQYFVDNSIAISHIYPGEQHTIFLATNDNVYSCGYGYYGQLGHDNTSDKYTPTLIQYFVDESITISKISTGAYYTIFLATNGYIYSCGWNADGQLGHGNTSAKYIPALIQYFVDESITISKISAGYYHSIFLSAPPSLVTWYKFDHDVTDSSGNNQDIILTTGTIDFHSGGVIGESCLIQNNEYCEISTTLAIDTLRSKIFTVSFWVKLNALGTAYYILGGWDNSASGSQRGGYHISFDGTQFYWARLCNNTFVSLTNTTAVSVSNWYHIVAVANDTEFSLFVNNNVITDTQVQLSTPHSDNTNNFGLGTAFRWGGSVDYDTFDGYLDDFRIYDIALSADEVNELYKPIDNAYNQSKYTLQFDSDTECDFLIVAGGGGGCGNNVYRAGGGGGAGELLEKYNITFSANTLYTVIVGNGGLGQHMKTSPAIEGYDSGIYYGTDGDIPFYHSKGGGRGGNGYYPGENVFDATSGGSGGGAGMISGENNLVNGLSVKYNTDGRGHHGKVNIGNDAGSGGGAGSIGEYASSSLGQAQSLPGKGYTSYITGEAVTYASGGYGGWQYSRNTANAGKGSGGWGYGGPQGQSSFPGGDGIDGKVIIRYKYVNTKPAPTITYSMNSWTYTDDGNVYYMGNVGIGKNDPTSTLDVMGNISATIKPFKIQHPLDNSKSLYHGNIECPRYDNLYRGRATIINGICIVNIDRECNDTGGLIEGTFDALNTDSQLYLQNNQTFDNIKGTIENGKIHIECENTEDEITINWIVIAERKDADVVKLNNTDSNGKMICEYFK